MRAAIPFDEFKALLERNKIPSAQITFYSDFDKFPGQVSVLDRHLPRRTEFGTMDRHGCTDELPIVHYEEDHFRESHICEMAYHNHMVPVRGNEGRLDERTGITRGIYRGALGAIQALVDKGSLRRTDELRRLFAQYERRLA